jgi:hypothetical protein
MIYLVFTQQHFQTIQQSYQGDIRRTKIKNALVESTKAFN